MTAGRANEVSFVLESLGLLESAVTEAKAKMDDPVALGTLLATLSDLVEETMPRLIGSDLTDPERDGIARIKGQISDLERSVSARTLVLSGFSPYLKGMIDG